MALQHQVDRRLTMPLKTKVPKPPPPISAAMVTMLMFPPARYGCPSDVGNQRIDLPQDLSIRQSLPRSIDCGGHASELDNGVAHIGSKDRERGQWQVRRRCRLPSAASIETPAPSPTAPSGCRRAH
jgi:hypothetical protein